MRTQLKFESSRANRLENETSQTQQQVQQLRSQLLNNTVSPMKLSNMERELNQYKEECRSVYSQLNNLQHENSDLKLYKKKYDLLDSQYKTLQYWHVILNFNRTSHERSERQLREQVKIYQDKSKDLEV